MDSSFQLLLSWRDPKEMTHSRPSSYVCDRELPIAKSYASQMTVKMPRRIRQGQNRCIKENLLYGSKSLIFNATLEPFCILFQEIGQWLFHISVICTIFVQGFARPSHQRNSFRFWGTGQSNMALTCTESALSPRYRMEHPRKVISIAPNTHFDGSAHSLLMLMHSSTARKWSMWFSTSAFPFSARLRIRSHQNKYVHNIGENGTNVPQDD